MNAMSLDLILQAELPAAARGSQDAYGRIVHACQNTVTAIALAITRDVQASEDIAQEAFLKAWQQLDRLKNSASFLPWLRQITRNLARDWLRAQHGRPMSGEVAEIVKELVPGARIDIVDHFTHEDLLELPYRGILDVEPNLRLGWQPRFRAIRDGLADYVERYRAFLAASA